MPAVFQFSNQLWQAATHLASAGEILPAIVESGRGQCLSGTVLRPSPLAAVVFLWFSSKQIFKRCFVYSGPALLFSILRSATVLLLKVLRSRLLVASIYQVLLTGSCSHLECSWYCILPICQLCLETYTLVFLLLLSLWYFFLADFIASVNASWHLVLVSVTPLFF